MISAKQEKVQALLAIRTFCENAYGVRPGLARRH